MTSRYLATCLLLASRLTAHDSGNITWSREVSRIFIAHCVGCHHAGGTAFPLERFADVRARVDEIKAAVLERRMPPWGAVKGFGDFRDDASLPQQQIQLIATWIASGTPEGNPKDLPHDTATTASPGRVRTGREISVSAGARLRRSVTVAGIFPKHIPSGTPVRIVAQRPDGSVEPLIWLSGYDARFAHPYLFRRPLTLPSGTVIQGLPPDASIALLPAT